MEHIAWVIEELAEWAETFVDDSTVYDYIHRLMENLSNNTCSEKDYNDILFHLWQISLGRE